MAGFVKFISPSNTGLLVADWCPLSSVSVVTTAQHGAYSFVSRLASFDPLISLPFYFVRQDTHHTHGARCSLDDPLKS